MSNDEILREIERKIILNVSALFKLDRVPRILVMMDMNTTHFTLYSDIFMPILIEGGHEVCTIMSPELFHF